MSGVQGMSGEAESLPGRVQSTGRKHRFSVTETGVCWGWRLAAVTVSAPLAPSATRA